MQSRLPGATPNLDPHAGRTAESLLVGGELTGVCRHACLLSALWNCAQMGLILQVPLPNNITAAHIAIGAKAVWALSNTQQLYMRVGLRSDLAEVRSDPMGPVFVDKPPTTLTMRRLCTSISFHFICTSIVVA